MDTATTLDAADAAEPDARADSAEPVTLPPMLPEGIHFGLDETAYHADPALGSGSIRALAKCPAYYWAASWMNPLREAAAETPALLYGRALHCLVLEGPDAFRSRYAVTPRPADYPGALVTADDIKNVLRKLPKEDLKAWGVKLSAAKPELLGWIREIDPGAIIFDDVLAAFREECSTKKISALDARTYGEIVQAAEYITGDPRVAAAFRGGRPEVSLFWEQDGVPMKARLDYVRLGKENGQPVALVTDLKSFANVMDAPPERAVINAISRTRLDVQAAAYFEGIKRIPEMVVAGKVYGTDGINTDWLTVFGSIPVENWRFYWCFYEKGFPVSMLRSTRYNSALLAAARMEMERALQAYRDNMEAFGTNWRFVDPVPDIEVMLDDLPKWLQATT